eukprot:IDg9413t1
MQYHSSLHFCSLLIEQKRKARNWWQTREFFLDCIRNGPDKPMQIVRRGMKRTNSTLCGYQSTNRKREKTTTLEEYIAPVLRDEFMRLRSARVKINRKFLLKASIDLVSDPTVPITQNDIEDNMQRPLHNILTMKWVDNFFGRFKITTRIRTGNKSLSPAETAKNYKYVAYPLGIFKRAYDDGLDLSTVENYDETNMILDLDDGQVLDFKGKKRVTY